MQSNGHTASSEMGLPIEQPATGTSAKEAQAPTIDLAAWAAGEVEAPFDQVQRAIDEYVFAQIDTFLRERFPRLPTNPREAVQFVVREGLLAEDEAREDLDEDE